MHEIKDSKQATVRIGFDGKVHKTYNGPGAEKRFDNETRVLKYLAEKGCDFVPKLLHENRDDLYIVTSNCGAIVNKLSEDKLKGLFSELESYGVKHDDPFVRNVTYNAHAGRFNLIDFEFATILDTGEGLCLEDVQENHRAAHKGEI